MNNYQVTLPIANDLPARSVVSMQVTAIDDVEAVMLAVERAQNEGYIIDAAPFRATDVRKV